MQPRFTIVEEQREEVRRLPSLIESHIIAQQEEVAKKEYEEFLEWKSFKKKDKDKKPQGLNSREVFLLMLGTAPWIILFVQHVVGK